MDMEKYGWLMELHNSGEQTPLYNGNSLKVWKILDNKAVDIFSKIYRSLQYN